jgi:hypothetical protein
MSILTTEFIEARTGFKLKFSSYEELYPLYDLLKAHLPKRSAAAAAPPMVAAAEEPAAEKPKKKKAKTVSAAEAELLAPADADDTGGDPPTLGATDPFRSNKYRLAALDPAHCVARKIDEANPIAGTRPGDDGANGKVFPETQCSKKATPGGRLCTTCAKKEVEYLADTAKVPKGWYGRLDEPLFHKAFVVGCEWFLTKYPAGIAEAPVSAAAAEKPKKPKKPAAEPVPEAATAAEKPKKTKKAAAAEPTPEAEPEPAVAAKPPKAKKAAIAEPEVAAEPEPVAAKPPKAKKASVAADGAPKDIEWITFLSDGVPLIRNTKSGNVYQCDRTKHRLEDMVQRDKYEGKWRDGRLDAYADEEDE